MSRKYKATIVQMTPSQSNYLDSIVFKLKKNGFNSISRSIFIRSLIDALQEQNINLNEIKNETELTNRIISS